MKWLRNFFNWIKRKFGMEAPFRIVILTYTDDNGIPLPDKETKYCVFETTKNITLMCYSNIEEAISARDKKIEEWKKEKIKENFLSIRNDALNGSLSKSTPKNDE